MTRQKFCGAASTMRRNEEIRRCFRIYARNLLGSRSLIATTRVVGSMADCISIRPKSGKTTRGPNDPPSCATGGALGLC